MMHLLEHIHDGQEAPHYDLDDTNSPLFHVGQTSGPKRKNAPKARGSTLHSLEVQYTVSLAIETNTLIQIEAHFS